MKALRIPQGSGLHLTAQGLAIEDVALADLARQHGTPLFVYSQAAMTAALQAYQRATEGRKGRIFYALKANSNLAIAQFFVRAGCGLDIVSGGELARALAVGCRGQDIIFSGVGKTRAEMRSALQADIGCFNVESLAELETLNHIALEMGMRARVSLRVNPDVDAQTHPYISTGLKDNKFGIAHDQALAAYQRAGQLPGIQVCGIDCHIGSQITQVEPYLDAMDRLLDLVQALESSGLALQHIDFGGGLGIDYAGETPPAANELWARLWARMDARGMGGKTVFIEPGRSLVGNAGVCLTQVLYLKPGSERNFCIVDAAMNDLPRPALYQAFHEILPVQPSAAEPQRWSVVGPVCESGDWIGHDRDLALAAGEVLAVASVGAYCMSMASNYNSRNRAAEVLVNGAQTHVIRQRERFADQWALERMLP